MSVIVVFGFISLKIDFRDMADLNLSRALFYIDNWKLNKYQNFMAEKTIKYPGHIYDLSYLPTV